MRYTALILTVFSVLEVNAQIILEQSYSNAGHFSDDGSWQQLYIVNLESAGAKYLFANKAGKKLKFYNPDHSHWKTINYSQAMDMNPDINVHHITYVSQHLFDLDDEIEFLYADNSATATQELVTQVINEDGTVIFTALGQAAVMIPTAPQDQLPIRNTPVGAKLILSDDGAGNGEAHVYGLPGTLQVGIEVCAVGQSVDRGTLSAFPNPSGSFVSLEYSLPVGADHGSIVFYDAHGSEVKRLMVDRSTQTLEVSTDSFSPGLYYCTLQTALGDTPARKLVLE